MRYRKTYEFTATPSRAQYFVQLYEVILVILLMIIYTMARLYVIFCYNNNDFANLGLYEFVESRSFSFSYVVSRCNYKVYLPTQYDCRLNDALIVIYHPFTTSYCRV